MNSEKLVSEVLKEINRSVLSISAEAVDTLAKELDREKRIFCDGMGRSRLQAEGFAMRLTQMGFSSSVVGGTTTPAITAEDVLLICSGSGETPMLVEHAVKAKTIGARVVLLTTDAESSLGKISDENILIRASSKNRESVASIQPMGSLFEQSVGILCDIMVLLIMKKYGIGNDEMYRNHSNLE